MGELIRGEPTKGGQNGERKNDIRNTARSIRNNTSLVELGRNRRKFGVQLSAKAIHNRDDRDRDARSDKAVLNRCGTRLVLEKLADSFPHDRSPSRSLCSSALCMTAINILLNGTPSVPVLGRRPINSNNVD